MHETTSNQRRRYAPEFKAKVVKQALSGQASKAAVARQHSINANLLSNWIREYRRNAFWTRKVTTPLVPIVLTEPATPTLPNVCQDVGSNDQVAQLTISLATGHQLTLDQASDAQIVQIIRTLL